MYISKLFLISILIAFANCEYDESSTTTTTTFSTKEIPDFSIPCKVPTFVKILPVSFRRQLKKIWAGVPMNADCGSQLAATRELVNNLPNHLKLKIAEFGELEDKFRANFFMELLPEEKAEFAEILKNLSMTAMEKAEKLREWGRDRLSVAAFENFEEYLSVFLERDRRFQQKLTKLSPEARKAYDRIQEIRKEKQLIFSKLSEKARRELASLFKGECSVHRPYASRVQWDPVGVKQLEEQVKENPELACIGVADTSPLFGLEYAALTRSYTKSIPTTPMMLVTSPPSPSRSYDPEFPSAGRKLFQLLLQRVQYLRPVSQD